MEERDAYFNAVYDSTIRELAKVCVQKARQIPDVDDLLQNTYIKFYQHIKRHGINQVRDPKSYLYTILSKELSRYYRFHANSQASPIEDAEYIPDTEHVPENDSVNNLTLDEIWEIVQKEPVLSQKVFILYYQYEMSLKEIADALSITV